MTRWSRFAGVGVMGFVAQLATLHLLTSQWTMHPLIAVTLAVEAAILHNFVWHERWTWMDRIEDGPRAAVLQRLLRFNAASGAISLLGNLVFTALFVSLHVPLLAANIAAVVCLTIVNYLITDRVTYALAPTAVRPGKGLATRRVRVRRSFFVWMTVAAAVGLGRPVSAAQLTPETIAAWNRYVAAVESRRARETAETGRFLAIDGMGDSRSADFVARLRRGEVLVDNIANGTVDLGAGTVSHWRGVVFIAGVRLPEILDNALLRGKVAAHRQEDVLESRVLARDADSLRLFLKLQRRAIVTVAYNTEHLVSYERLGEERAMSRSTSTRIAELRDPGTLSETEKPIGQDRGFLWRLHSYWRYQAIHGGVIVELESLTLSRDIPWGVRLVAGPVIERIARESMTRTLTSLRARFTGSAAN
jgi:putative flippase GtrA